MVSVTYLINDTGIVFRIKATHKIAFVSGCFKSGDKRVIPKNLRELRFYG